jgi:hypothetical protein
MGIESPNINDLNTTRKGITIRDFGGVAAGTFVIGLPNQTEEEIKYFPTYAKEIGLMSATFGIATPFPGTDFYTSLEREGLIFERDWTKYDENNSVFTLPTISKRRIEELRTYCLGKFWTPDTFFDYLAIVQKRDAAKTNLSKFIMDRLNQLEFLAKAGSTQQASPENMITHYKVFVEAMVDPRVKKHTEKVGMHQVIDMSRFLAILGPQTIQLTIRYDNVPLTSYIMKTTRNTVEYISIISGKQDNATLNFDLNLNYDDFNGRDTSPIKLINDVIQNYVYQVLKPVTVGNVQETLNAFRFTLATCIAAITQSQSVANRITNARASVHSRKNLS